MFNVFGKKPTVEGRVVRLCLYGRMRVGIYLMKLKVSRYLYMKSVLFM
jgi:hypothetical protein